MQTNTPEKSTNNKTKGIYLFFSFFLITANTTKASQENNYKLRANDKVQLYVYEEPELSTQVRILKTGQASFPLIGSVDIAGMSISDATEKIKKLYQDDFLVNPKITLSVDDYATDYVSVIGAVKRPGQLAIPEVGSLDLGSAVASAGGVNESADLNKIQLIRANGNIINFTLEQLQGHAGRVALMPGDRVIVNESLYVNKSVSILGQVEKPGAISFPSDGRLDLVTAIARAGGLSSLANPKKVSINRKGKVLELDFREISQKSNSPYWLQPDDIITVAERIF